MAIKEVLIEGIKQIVGKSITVGATYIIANNGLNTVIGFFLGSGAVSPIEMKLLIIGASYAVWSQAIVPIVDELYAKLQPKQTAGARKKTTGKYFDLINLKIQ
jgi:hypothetical protein